MGWGEALDEMVSGFVGVLTLRTVRWMRRLGSVKVS